MNHPRAAFPSPAPCVLAFFDPACLGWAVDGIRGFFGEHVGKGQPPCCWLQPYLLVLVLVCFLCFFFNLTLVVMLIDACYCRGTFTYIPKEPLNHIPDPFEMLIVVVSRNTYQSRLGDQALRCTLVCAVPSETHAFGGSRCTYNLD